MIHIVTDSTADINAQLLKDHFDDVTVHVIPLTVHFGDKEYLDGVDLDRSHFYDQLRAADEMPRTSQPSPAAFIELYERISEPGDTILSYHISSRLSGTIQSASLAARQVEDRTIEVIDTRSVSLGLGLIAIKAAQAGKNGRDAADIIQESRELIAGHEILFLVDTLEYLHRNGRIGKAQALVGGLLSVKPILTLEDGVVTPFEKVRGERKAKERLFQLVNERIEQRGVQTGVVLHADALDEATSLAERLGNAHPEIQWLPLELGPTVGTHAGPGAIGVVIFER